MAKYLIVGGVAGGMSAAARLRRLDEKSEIIVFERGDYISYANCGLPYYIGDTIKERDMLLVQTPEAFKARFNVDVRIKNEVLSIDRKKRQLQIINLQTQEKYTETYDRLILSPGAEPILPPISGIDHPSIFTLRSIPDTDKIKSYIKNHPIKRALVVGAGFIGLEMAENLHQLGVFVTIVEMANQVMNVVDYEMAAVISQHLKTKNVEFYLKDSVCVFKESHGHVVAKLISGREIECDMVVLSIGVKPENRLAKEAGLEIGERGGISVNEYLQTNDPEIYAIGDAIETLNPITGKKGVIPLAGPANKQGRMVADNIVLGDKKKYNGTIGTSIAKVFDLTVGVTGVTEKVLKREKMDYRSFIIHASSHAGYYPNALPMTLKIIYSPKDGKLLGAQIVGYDGVDKRLDIIASLILCKKTIYELQEIEHAYAPPYSSAKDPVNMAGFVAENLMNGYSKIIQWDEILKLDRKESFFLDVRTEEEARLGTIDGSVIIPLDEIRQRISEIPKNKKIIVFCGVGLRGYVAARILSQNGFNEVYNLSGGYKTYELAIQKQENGDIFEGYKIGLDDLIQRKTLEQSVNKALEVNACGLQCPGPIMKTKNEMERIQIGEQLKIKATDPGFYKDIQSWARVTGNKLISIKQDKGTIEAVIEKTEKKMVQSMQENRNHDKTIVVFDSELDKALASFVIANGALAMGRKVTLFFTFWGLNVIRKQNNVKGLKKSLIEKMFGFMLPRGSKKLSLSQMNMGGMGTKIIRWLMKKKKIDSLETMIKSAIESGAELIACQMSMDLMGIKPEELLEGVKIGGVATYLEAAEKADANLFI